MEIAVISGKGGTGKSCISAAFATLSEKIVLADCDVDAANLHIMFNPEKEEEQIYIAGQEAIVDYSLCDNCKKCIDYCRFDAISYLNDKIVISPVLCEGCELCMRVCPTRAIDMKQNDKSRMHSGKFRNGIMVYGRLAPGEENSGKLVNMVREKAKLLSKSHNLKTIIIDGPPGIGCPVISTITGVDKVVIVTEPSISGINDLKRTIELTLKFNPKIYVIINKSNLNNDISNHIEAYCKDIKVEVIEKLPFCSSIVEAMTNCKSIMEWEPKSKIANKINMAFKKITNN